MGISCKLSKERYSFSDGVNIFALEENFPVRAKKESLQLHYLPALDFFLKKNSELFAELKDKLMSRKTPE